MNEQTKENRISKEYDRISCYFESVGKGQREVIDPLLQNAAFMKVTLEDLQDEIIRNGVIEEYQNGEHQKGVKQSASLQSYNSLIKNYASVIKSLSSILPPESKTLLAAMAKWKPREKTEEEIEAERLAQEERTRQINLEIERAAERQREEREQSAKRFEDFSKTAAARSGQS